MKIWKWNIKKKKIRKNWKFNLKKKEENWKLKTKKVPDEMRVHELRADASQDLIGSIFH